MTPPLFLLDALPAIGATTFDLDGPEGRHAATVLRLAVGERLLAGDGAGTVLDCEVAAVGSGQLRLTIRERRLVAAPQPRVVVAQALAKGERSEFAVELMTELGVDAIIPWAAARSVTQWRGSEKTERALARWRSTAREATKQSRRAWLPEVGSVVSTRELCARLAHASAAFVLEGEATLALAEVELPREGTVLLVVGPEGGIGSDELDQFIAAGAQLVRLGTPVLRTSTAGGAALAAMSPRLRRWT